MSRIYIPGDEQPNLSRRRFVTGIAAGGALLGMGFNVNAKTNNNRAIATTPQTLRGTNFNLSYSPTPINLTGKDILFLTLAMS